MKPRVFVVKLRVFDSCTGFLFHFQALASSSKNSGMGVGIHPAKPPLFPDFMCEIARGGPFHGATLILWQGNKCPQLLNKKPQLPNKKRR